MKALREVVEAALQELQALSEVQASFQPAPEVWSAKQIIGHLTDSAANNHGRFVRAALENGLTLPDYDQNAWVRLGDWQGRGWPELLLFWQAYQLHLAHLIERLTPAQLAHSLTVGDETATLGFLVEDYVQHQLHHLAQLRERVGA